jgi:hypothetical protein
VAVTEIEPMVGVIFLPWPVAVDVTDAVAFTLTVRCPIPAAVDVTFAVPVPVNTGAPTPDTTAMSEVLTPVTGILLTPEANPKALTEPIPM